jgi:hypothetical protein
VGYLTRQRWLECFRGPRCGRVHLPIQPSAIDRSRQALLPSRAASGRGRTRCPRILFFMLESSRRENTICRGHTNQADTTCWVEDTFCTSEEGVPGPGIGVGVGER